MVPRIQRLTVWSGLVLLIAASAGCGSAGRGGDGTQAEGLTVSVRTLASAGCPVELSRVLVEATSESLLVRLAVESNTKGIIDSLSVECTVADASARVQVPLAAPCVRTLHGKLEPRARVEHSFSVPIPSQARESLDVTSDSLKVIIEPVSVFFPNDREWERAVAVPL